MTAIRGRDSAALFNSRNIMKVVSNTGAVSVDSAMDLQLGRAIKLIMTEGNTAA